MAFRDIVYRSRSVRRFHESAGVDLETLVELADMARMIPSARNLQPLRYILSADRRINAQIFPSLLWAGYLSDWDGPSEGERPSAYILILSDKETGENVKWDHGIAAQTIMLGAAAKGLSGCIIGALRKNDLMSDLEIPVKYEIELIIALGAPKENIIVDPLDEGGSILYWRDGESNHHVPKRRLEDVIIKKF